MIHTARTSASARDGGACSVSLTLTLDGPFPLDFLTESPAAAFFRGSPAGSLETLRVGSLALEDFLAATPPLVAAFFGPGGRSLGFLPSAAGSAFDGLLGAGSED